jgi:hypothetical protein
LEVAFQVRSYAKVMVASEESEPNDGWPYERILRHLRDDPDLPSKEMAEHIVQDYIQSYIDRGYQGEVTQTALDLDKIDDLTGPLDALAEALTAEDRDQMRFNIWNAIYRTPRFWGNTLLDLNQFCVELEKQAVTPASRQVSQQVRAAMAQGTERFVITEAHNGKKVERCGGVTIYLPAMGSMSRFYPELAYASEHQWVKLVEAYQI